MFLLNLSIIPGILLKLVLDLKYFFILRFFIFTVLLTFSLFFDCRSVCLFFFRDFIDSIKLELKSFHHDVMLFASLAKEPTKHLFLLGRHNKIILIIRILFILVFFLIRFARALLFLFVFVIVKLIRLEALALFSSYLLSTLILLSLLFGSQFFFLSKLLFLYQFHLSLYNFCYLSVHYDLRGVK